MAINPMQNYAQAGFWSGAVVMISFHNMIVSILMYKSRQTNASNILKIFFNFGQLVRTLGIWSYYMTPDLPTVSLCTGIKYFLMFGNVISRISLSAFLLWRLRQINLKNDKLDKIMSVILFVAKVVFTVPDMIMQIPGVMYNPLTGKNICNPLNNESIAYSIGGIATDFIIDIYVTARLVYILKIANKNASQARASSNVRSRRTLFTAVMYWNFLRLFVAFLFDFTGVVDQYFPVISDAAESADAAVKCTIYILLSYVITVDAEIVKVIEGKDTKRGTSSGTLKSVSSSRTPRYSGSNPPKYSPTQSTSQIGEDKIAVVSMKRLSFFEWANVVVGGRLFKNKGDEQYDDEYDDKGTEEVIDGPSDSTKDEDTEKGIPQDRRSSNFSGTTTATETSTLDGNPDIVIN